MSAITTNPKPLHVLISTTVGRAWTVALEIARALSARQAMVTLVVLGPAAEPDQRAIASAIANLDLVDLGGVGQDMTTDSADVDVQGIRLAMLAVDQRPDLVHLHNPVLAAHARFPCPVLVVSAPVPQAPDWYVEMATRGLKAADAVIALDDAGKDATVEQTLAACRDLMTKAGRPALPAMKTGG